MNKVNNEKKGINNDLVAFVAKHSNENRFFKRLFVLSNFDASSLFSLHFLTWCVLQVFMGMIEELIWGEKFVNFVDPIMTITIITVYVIAFMRMADTVALYALAKDSKKENKQPLRIIKD